MANVLVNEQSLSGIAAAIRAKLGVQTTFKPGQMAAAIGSIPVGGGGSKAPYLISDGDTVATIYINTEYDPDTMLASLTYSDTDPVTGLDVCMLGFSNPEGLGGLNNLFAVDLTGGEYAIVWNDGTTVTPIYSTTAVVEFGVTTAGWQMANFAPETPVTVDADYIDADFSAVMDTIVAKSSIAFGEHGSGGTQPQLHAPAISITGTTLTVTNPTSNGSYVESYKIYVDGVLTYITSATSCDLSGIAANTASITATACGDGFSDSPASSAATYYRHFTVSMYDEDTLLTTESVACGSLPTYVPTKTGFTFVKWTDVNGNEVSAVTGEMNLYASWINALVRIPAGQYDRNELTGVSYFASICPVFEIDFSWVDKNSNRRPSVGIEVGTHNSNYGLYNYRDSGNSNVYDKLMAKYNLSTNTWVWDELQPNDWGATGRITVNNDAYVTQKQYDVFFTFFHAYTS